MKKRKVSFSPLALKKEKVSSLSGPMFVLGGGDKTKVKYSDFCNPQPLPSTTVDGTFVRTIQKDDICLSNLPKPK